MPAPTDRHHTAPYRTQGGAAYDIFRKRQVELPEEQPEKKQEPKRPVRVRAHVSVSPFSVVGLAAAAFLAVLVIFGYVRLYEVNSEISTLERELAVLQEETGKLESSYENQFDLVEIEKQALALGMTQPRKSQKVYIDLGASDHAEITPAGGENLFSRVFGALRDSVLGFVEYLS